MHLFHIAARVLRTPAPLCSFDIAPRLWAALRRTFPSAIANTLMPDHVHTFTPGADADEARRAMSAMLSGLRRSRHPLADVIWDRVSTPVRVPDPKHALRTVRYLALNPNRAGLVRDPLEWPWSTYRDVMGGCVDPWVTEEGLARALQIDKGDFTDWLHEYVSGDPSASVGGTPPPRPAPHALVCEVPLREVIDAAAAATRGHPRDIVCTSETRALFVPLAAHAGWTQRKVLSAATGMSPSAVDRARRRGHPALAAGALCLGDPRLRVTPPPCAPHLEPTRRNMDGWAMLADARRFRALGEG